MTSADAVLIQEQSYSLLIDELKAGDRVGAMSTSTQSRASIAAKVGMSALDTVLRLSACMKQREVRYMLDAASAGDQDKVLRQVGGRVS